MDRIKQIPRLPARRRDAHKGDFGRVLVIGGSRGMIGAPALAAISALRGGAGLVRLAVPAAIQQTTAALCPCATSLAIATEEDGAWGPGAIRQVSAAAAECDVLAVGPGLATGAGQEQLLRAVLQQTRPVVLDADGLNNLARIDDWPALRRCPLVLTPHPGECSRLTDRSIADIQAGREAAASEAITRWRAASKSCDAPLILVLKGAGTIVTDGERLFLAEAGNPGLATGGSGDVLTGLIAGLSQQGIDVWQAACLGVHVHARAGDLAAGKYGEVSLIASDLPDFIPQALREGT